MLPGEIERKICWLLLGPESGDCVRCPEYYENTDLKKLSLPLSSLKRTALAS